MINAIKKIIQSEVSKQAPKKSYAKKIAVDPSKITTIEIGKISH